MMMEARCVHAELGVNVATFDGGQRGAGHADRVREHMGASRPAARTATCDERHSGRASVRRGRRAAATTACFATAFGTVIAATWPDSRSRSVSGQMAPVSCARASPGDGGKEGGGGGDGGGGGEGGTDGGITDAADGGG